MHYQTKRVLSLLGAVLLLLQPIGARALHITELLASNDIGISDEDGDRADWFEIYNETASVVSLDGWYVTDDPDDLTQWRIPNVDLAAGAYLLIWASGKDRDQAGSELHTNFKLSAGGEYLGLVQPDGLTVEHEYAPEFPEGVPDVTQGLTAALDAVRCFLNPTPGAANDESLPCGFVDDIAFSVQRGFYDSVQSLELSTGTVAASIRYTLDASTPSATNGLDYAGPIDINTTTTVRAIGIGPGLEPSAVATHTYIFVEDVMQQSFDDLVPTYPTHWTGGVGADYDMDPRIVDDPVYNQRVREGLRAIPTISLVTDIANLFDPATGIYMNTQSRGVAWERPVSMEMMHSDGREDFQINAGFRIQGGVSRTRHNKKHNLRLLFKSIYGSSKLEAEVFPDSDVRVFDTFTLTGGHGDAWHNGHGRGTLLRDTWAKDTQLAMGQPASHSTYVHLYINGIYWGLYRPTERPSAPFLAEHLGGDEEDYDALNAGKIIDGDSEAWDTAQALATEDLSLAANYEALAELVDYENLADYMIMNMYAGNTDWDFKNWYAGRRREPGEGFKFFSWDAEQIFASAFGDRTTPDNHNSPSSIYDDLRRKSPEFRVLFGDRVEQHLRPGGALSPDQAWQRLERRMKEIDTAIVVESARWGDKVSKDPYERDSDWVPELLRLKLSLFPLRSDVLRGQFVKRGLYPSFGVPSLVPPPGAFNPGASLVLLAPEDAASAQIYWTSDGSDPREAGGSPSASANLYTNPLPLSSTLQIRVRALVDGEWSALTDGVYSPFSALRISELHYNPAGDLDTEFIEVTNIGTTALALEGHEFTEGVSFDFPAESLAPGEQALVVDDIDDFRDAYGPTPRILGKYSGGLSNNGEQVLLLDGAGNIVHDFTYDDLWYRDTDGIGASLVAADPAADATALRSPSGWRASAIDGGTPGRGESAECADGVDNDGDGHTDFGADPGCASASGIEAPPCNDGIDNDNDGAIDLADSRCATASGDESVPELGAFTCYRVRDEGERIRDLEVNLNDGFDGDTNFEVRKVRSLCLAGTADYNQGSSPAPALVSYTIGEASGQSRHLRRTDLSTRSAFGPLSFDTSRANRLIVPAGLGIETDPTAPGLADAYKCYDGRQSRNTPKFFPSGAQVTISNVLEERALRLRPLKRICAPVSLNSGAIVESDRWLFCYPGKQGKFSFRHDRRSDLRTTDELRSSNFSTLVEEEVCIAGTVLGVP